MRNEGNKGRANVRVDTWEIKKENKNEIKKIGVGRQNKRKDKVKKEVEVPLFRPWIRRIASGSR
jgi:hypothetical protein